MTAVFQRDDGTPETMCLTDPTTHLQEPAIWRNRRCVGGLSKNYCPRMLCTLTRNLAMLKNINAIKMQNKLVKRGDTADKQCSRLNNGGECQCRGWKSTEYQQSWHLLMCKMRCELLFKCYTLSILSSTVRAMSIGNCYCNTTITSEMHCHLLQ